MTHPTNRQARRAIRAMKSAQRRGVNPLNSWSSAEAIFKANERREMQREAEREARDLAEFHRKLDAGLIG